MNFILCNIMVKFRDLTDIRVTHWFTGLMDWLTGLI